MLKEFLQNNGRREMKETLDITESQFNRFLKVQKSGKYNMLSPQARGAAGLDKITFLTIVTNYDLLAEKFKNNA